MSSFISSSTESEQQKMHQTKKKSKRKMSLLLALSHIKTLVHGESWWLDTYICDHSLHICTIEMHSEFLVSFMLHG